MTMIFLLHIGPAQANVFERVIAHTHQPVTFTVQRLPTRKRLEQPGKRPLRHQYKTFLTFHLLALPWG